MASIMKLLRKLTMRPGNNHCFATLEGKRVLEDLTQRFIFQNNTPFGSENANYESAYHNGESGVVKFLINQIQQAEIL
jgi:hypothetical protein